MMCQKVNAGSQNPKKILWVDSYDEDYEWSLGLERGIRQALTGSNVELKIWRMDTKRHQGAKFGRMAGALAMKFIYSYKPDIVIASDDSAQEYLVVPFLKDSFLPVVFCGVSENPSKYGYPAQNITGMIEIEHSEKMFEQLRRFAGGERAGYLDGDCPTARIIAARSNKDLFQGRLKIYLVRTMEEFKQAFLQAQKTVDMLVVRNYAGIKDWNAAEAEAFLAAHTRIPTGSVNSWMSRYVLLTYGKVPEEQGEYAAKTALKILGGASPAEMPIEENKMAQLTVNLKMAKAAEIVLPVSILQIGEVIGREVYEEAVSITP